MKIGAAAFVLIVFFLSAKAQNKYWVSFTDKAKVTFDPYSYFDARTITQRLLNNIPVNDSSDYPVNAAYLSKVSELVDSTSWSSRWLNGVAVYCNPGIISLLYDLPFVKNIEPMSLIGSPALFNEPDDSLINDLSDEGKALLHYQTQRLQGDTFALNHIDGKGIRIAVFDAGFPGVMQHPAFEHLRRNNQIIETYDFIRKDDYVFKNHWHGAATLACIAGRIDGVNIGMATGAEFYLARTENVIGELFSEEENWLAAAEWADKYGVNIISSSLGYTNKRYFNYEMDGHKSLVARAATIAASKGILVANAAGNEGANDWHYIDTPGDADSVLTVGGTDPYKDMHIYFSSFGPSSSGKLKPNVCASGEVISVRSTGFSKVSGTSFSTPLVAGFAACAWQTHRQWSNMELFDAIEKSAHLYPYFDYAHGFGIPQAGYFFKEPQEPETTFDFVILNNDIKVILREKFSYPDAEIALGYNPQRNFFYKIEDKDGIMKKYFVLLAEDKEMLHFFAEDFETGDVLTVHFEGCTRSIDFPEINKQ